MILITTVISSGKIHPSKNTLWVSCGCGGCLSNVLQLNSEGTQETKGSIGSGRLGRVQENSWAMGGSEQGVCCVEDRSNVMEEPLAAGSWLAAPVVMAIFRVNQWMVDLRFSLSLQRDGRQSNTFFKKKRTLNAAFCWKQDENIFCFCHLLTQPYLWS